MDYNTLYILRIAKTLYKVGQGEKIPSRYMVNILDTFDERTESFRIEDITHKLVKQNFIRIGARSEFHFHARPSLLDLMKQQGSNITIFDGTSNLSYMHDIIYVAPHEIPRRRLGFIFVF